jgi:cholestenol delta-isomerase
MKLFAAAAAAAACLPGVTRHTRPEFIYFWFYFVIVNAVWLAVPMLCMIHAAKKINRAIAG